MLREFGVALSCVICAPGCSLLLDFDQAVPADAAPDSPFTQAECDYLEPNEDVGTSKQITPADTGPAAICNVTGGDDLDFYSFVASSSPTTIAITFVQRPGGDLDLKLFDGSGTMIASSRTFNTTESITCPGASPDCSALTSGATYHLEVFGGVPSAMNSYTISLSP
jgi:hypothetical protein